MMLCLDGIAYTLNKAVVHRRHWRNILPLYSESCQKQFTVQKNLTQQLTLTTLQ